MTLLTTGLDATSKSSLMECAKNLNWKVLNDFSPEGMSTTALHWELVCNCSFIYSKNYALGDTSGFKC